MDREQDDAEFVLYDANVIWHLQERAVANPDGTYHATISGRPYTVQVVTELQARGSTHIHIIVRGAADRDMAVTIPARESGVALAEGGAAHGAKE